MWGCSHGSVQWYERAGCDIVHIAEWEWPWRMITGQCGECLVRCHDASDSSDTGWLCNTSEAGHNPVLASVKAEQKSNVSVRTSKLPKYFPSTDNKFLYDRSPDLKSHAATICYDPPLHRLIWSWMTSSLVLNMMSGEAEVISHPASEIISWSYWVLDSDCLGGIIPRDHDWENTRSE